MDKLTSDQIQKQADALSDQYKVKIHPLVFVEEDTDEQIVGFLKEPPRIVKLRALDKSITSPMTAASEVLEACLVKDASDPRILSENPEHDKIYFGACMAASSIIQFSANTFKKK